MSKSQTNKEFIRGAALVIAEIISAHDQPSMAMDIMKSCGITHSDLVAAEVDVHDLEIIEPILIGGAKGRTNA